MKGALRIRSLVSCLVGMGLAAVPLAQAQHIEFTAGSADLVVFYDAEADRFDTVFRQKGNTVAGGLTQPYGSPPGGTGSGNDYVFESLSVELNLGRRIEVEGRTYYSTPAAGGLYARPDKVEMGILPRLRELRESDSEEEEIVSQFETLRWTLDPAASTMPDGAEVILFEPGRFSGSFDVQLATADGDLSYEFPDEWHHLRAHWGFSELGDYELVFNMEGIGGEYAEADASGSVTIHFSVINDWFGYAVGPGYYLYTAEWGPLFIEHEPWVYSYERRKYLYIDEDMQRDMGIWIFDSPD